MSILDHLPRRAKNDTMIQGRIPLDLAREVKKVMARRKLSMSDVLIACFRHFLAATEIHEIIESESNTEDPIKRVLRGRP